MYRTFEGLFVLYVCFLYVCMDVWVVAGLIEVIDIFREIGRWEWL